MPGSTPKVGLPTMLDSDPLATVAQAIRDLAGDLDDLLPYADSVTVNIAAANNATQAVVFPVGRFSSPPKVVATSLSSNWFAFVSNVTAAGCNVGVRQWNGTASTTSVACHFVATPS